MGNVKKQAGSTCSRTPEHHEMRRTDTDSGAEDAEDYFGLWIASQHKRHDIIAYMVQLCIQMACYLFMSYKVPQTFRIKGELTLLSWHMLMVLVYTGSIFVTESTRFYVRYRWLLLVNLRVVNLAMLSSLAAAMISHRIPFASSEVCWWVLALLVSVQGLFGAPLSFQLQSIIGLGEAAYLVFKPWEMMSCGKGVLSWIDHLELGNLSKTFFQLIVVLFACYILPIHCANQRGKRMKLRLLGDQASDHRRRLKEMLEKSRRKAE
ncbi:hypothetical protein DUNSADRAFT_14912 [Dunaliella salina]|uniref:Uncharacterized protein n=1 Tax=Dunaliella salina TaxID=3046 RepID=A0ABQ7G6F1_DUNSA|nr:hypothetical protein DUNSADRAFT_14912 [Dunaliella salina]|eukprot:KAF5830182.1 hypothetical protein DUNSADRAFT_14912 [Dunaliella salina]